MEHFKEKVPKERVHPTVALLAIAVTGAAILSIGTAVATPVFAAPPSGETPGHSDGHGTPRTEAEPPSTSSGQPTDPNCFGEINSGLAQSSGGVGEHASDPVPGDDDRETPRLGVGNQAEGTPGEHGLTVGPIILGPGACEEGPSSQN